MNSKFSKEELIAIVERIMRSDGTDDELDGLLEIFVASVPHPSASDLIFYPAKEGQSSTEIVEAAISYLPIQLGNSA